MAIDVVVPPLGESVKQAILIKWHKADGDTVAMDDPVCELETDKANVDINAQGAGIVRRVREEGDTVAVGEVVARIEQGNGAAKPATKTAAANQSDSSAPSAASATATLPPPIPPQTKSTAAGPQPNEPTPPEDLSPAVRALVTEYGLDAKSIRATGPNGRLTKEDVQSYLDARPDAGNGTHAPDRVASDRVATAREEIAPPKKAAPPPVPPEKRKDIATAPAKPVVAPMLFDAGGEHRAPMSKMRIAIAKALVNAQHTAAILTTFNEVDMTAIMDLRAKYKERFQEVHGIGLGFMSFFARACVLALKEYPRVNASIDGTDVVYHQHVHLGIAVSTDRGLAVPVLRNVQEMSLARIEAEIKRVATATRDGKLGIDELSGGTFTITNGGVFGSLLSTPIINPPQSGILGMHAIQKRPIVVSDKIEIRSMMYIALSYDHRLVDGRESVSFLVRLKQYLEDPSRLMLEI